MGDGVEVPLLGSALCDFGVDAPTYPAHEVTIQKWNWNQSKLQNGTYAPVDAANYTFTYSIQGFGYDASANCTFEIRQSKASNSNPLQITIAPDKPYYLEGEAVTFTCTVINTQNQPVAYPSSKEAIIERIGGSYLKANADDSGAGVNEHITYDVDNIPTYPANSNTSFTWRWFESKNDNQTIPHEPGFYKLTYSISGKGYSASTTCVFEIR